MNDELAAGGRIRLIGPPCIDGADGRELKGVKPWAVMARVVLAETPVSRRRLAAELFPDADDPLGAVRWALASVRRALGASESFTADPIEARLPAGWSVDALDVLAGRLDLAATGELLEGLEPDTGPEFTTWLLVMRRHIGARIDALLHDELIRALSRRDVDRAIELGGIAAARSPFDERAQVLFVRALASSGDADRAVSHVVDVERRFRTELGCEPSPALRSAARRSVSDAPPGVSTAAIAGSLLDAGRAAVTAGAIDAGLDCYRRAVAAADRSGDRRQIARCRLALGSSLVHAVRGFDDEGSVLLGEAAHVAQEADDVGTAVEALRELGYVDAIAGRRPESQARLDLARELAGDDAALLSGVDAVAGLNLSDWGRTAEGLRRFESAVELARSAGDARNAAWAQGIGGWTMLSAGRDREAVSWLSESLELARSIGWVAFEPWPCTLLAAAKGPVAADELEWCFAMSCQLEDPCWEGASARALAEAEASRGDREAALRWIGEARRRAGRKPDVWVRMVGEILLSEARLRIDADDVPGGRAVGRDAAALAARAQLDDVLRRCLELLDRSG